MTVLNGYTDVKTWLPRARINSYDAADDAVIEEMIGQASRLIDVQTGRRFWKNTADETRYYQSENGFAVDTFDIVSVTSIKLDTKGDRTYPVTLALTDFDLTPDDASLDGKPYTSVEIAPNGTYTFPTMRRGIQITGIFGWPSIPEPIVWACEDIVTSAYKRRTGESTTGAATVTGAGVVITPKDIPDSAWKIIWSYARRL